MKKRWIAVCIIALFLFAGCRDKNAMIGAFDAEILHINATDKTMTVKGIDDDSILGDSCLVDCGGSDIYFVYADFETSDAFEISFDDFIVGDHIIADIGPVEDNRTVATRIQLTTQRM